MPFLSRQLAGCILPHDSFGSHLDSSSLRTVDVDLEKRNFAKADEIMADLFSEIVADGFEVTKRLEEIGMHVNHVALLCAS